MRFLSICSYCAQQLVLIASECVLMFLVPGCHNAATLADTADFPLSAYDDPIVLPVTIGGRVHQFVLDSGSTFNLVHTSLQSSLGKLIQVERASACYGEIVDVSLHKAPNAQIGVCPISRFEVFGCFDLSAIRSVIGRDIEGILGVPFLKSNVVQLDFDRRRLTLLPCTTAPVPEWGDEIQVHFSQIGLPCVSARFDLCDVDECLVDTGYSGSLCLESPSFQLLERIHAMKIAGETRAASLAGFHSSREGWLHEFELAGNTHRHLLVEEEGDSGRVGLKYLRRYRVTLDLAQNRFFLAPGAEYSRKDQRPNMGIRILSRDGKVVVAAVDAGSPGEQSSVQVDDVLVSINGESMDTKSNGEIRWMIENRTNADGDLVLHVKRASKDIHLIVTPKSTAAE